MIGRTLSHFKITGKLGKGGMGEVYLATDTKLRRNVALKILPPEMASDGDRLRRFQREAETVAALNHPHIVHLYSVEECDGIHFLTMEWVEGRSLAEEVPAGGLPIEPFFDLAIPLVDALAAAHCKGITHRDLKPANIMITTEGRRVKVLDFGLAKLQPAGDPVEETGLATMELTREGQLLGTVPYMSPEQVEGKEIDHRSDIFSLGIIFYELLTGRRPFRGDSPARLISSILTEAPPPVTEARDEIPRHLQRILSRCLEKDCSKRYQSSVDLCNELKGLREEIRALAAALATPPVAAKVRSGGGLPARRTRFFGRERELEEVGRLLSDPAVRLVTLTGTGGTGKTRLAVEAAANLASELEDRIFFVPLAGLSQPDLVAPEIALALGAPRGDQRSATQAISDAIEELGGPTLVVLDSFEHLAPAAPVLGNLLEAAPDLKLLVTSRELLHLYGEHDYPVAPLAVPRQWEQMPLAELARQPAVGLFVDRAQAAQPSFRLDADNAPAVAELTARLDGLPLALELAAARVRLLAPKDLVRRLARRLDVLTGGACDLPDRQRTLRNTIDWSHDLLDGEEKIVFRRLAVFPSGFTLEGAEAVVDPHGDLAVGMTEAVGSLLDKSLVHHLAAEGDPRFSLLETVREYALERLRQAGEEAPTREAHAAYFLVLAEEGASVLAQGEDPSWLATFAREHDNFLSALDWLATTDRTEWALRMALGNFHFWERTELLAEGDRRLRALLDLPASEAHARLRAKAFFAASVLATALGEAERAIALNRESLEMHRALGDPWGILVALNGRSVALADLKRFDEARECQEEALALGTELGDDMVVARSLSNLGTYAMAEGKPEEARERYRKAAEIFSKVGDRLGFAWSLNHEGDVARAQRDLPSAAALYQEALGVFRELDDGWGIGGSLADLGLTRRLDGDLPGAMDFFQRALKRFAELGYQRGVARVLVQLAMVAAEGGDGDAALRIAGAAAAIKSRLGLKESGRSDWAALEERLARLSAPRGDQATQARREGERMRWRAAVDYVLELSVPS